MLLARGIIGCNGIYDLLCAIAMLYWPESLLGSIHINVFQEDTVRFNPIVKRLLAHWVFTYGVARLMVMFIQQSWLYFFVAVTYTVEGLYFESCGFSVGSVHEDRAFFVFVACFVLTALSLILFLAEKSKYFWMRVHSCPRCHVRSDLRVGQTNTHSHPPV